jgi:endo-1,4-beta-xylanase
MKKLICFSSIFTILISGCQTKEQIDIPDSALKDVFQDVFMIGTAINSEQIAGKDEKSLALVKKQFNSITAENILKWEVVHPKPDEYSFDEVDEFVQFGEENDMFIVGHTLVWHNQTPDWVFEDGKSHPLDRQALLERMKNHILTVVRRYKGKIHGWDVVNEAFDDQGNYRKTNWLEIIGQDYIEKAFQWAHEADPETELYYNDYNMWYEGRRDAVLKMVKDLQSKDIPIHGIGLQGHWGLDYPPHDKLEAAIKAYAETGLKVMITELDIDALPQPDSDVGAEITKNFELQKELNPYEKGLPDSVQTALSNQYSALFKILLKYQKRVNRVTFWGAHDGVSWKNNWPIRGRTSYPMLFDRDCQPKPAFYEVVKLLNKD